jgi:predicted ATPase
LRAGFASAVSGRGLLLCVSGEPGIGKTTLVEDFLSDLSTSHPDCLIARGRCSERLAGSASYLPWLEALESLLRGGENVSLFRARKFDADSITQIMKQSAPAWYAQVAPAQIAEAPQTEAERVSSPERMKRELGALLQEVSRAQPLVLFFDDLHWADVSTMDLLAYLAGRFNGLRLLIVATYRPSDLLLARHPFLQLKPDLQARGVCHEIQLEFLNREEIEQYLALEFPQHRFPPELPHLIHTKTEGSPLFMADLARYLRARQVIAQKEGHWALAQSLPAIERDLPESVRAMIERKVAHLSEEDRRLLVAASVQGYEFDSAVVARVLGKDAAEVEERLEALERVYAFVRQVEEREFPDHTLTLRYRFIHVLYQNALYGLLRPTRKASLSGAAAQALLDYYGKQSSSVASELAILFETARDFRRAAEYFLLAAQNAAHLSANKEVVVLARRGLEALKLLPETPERAQQELRLQTTLGPALMSTMGYGAPEVEAVYTRARELCPQVGETPQLFAVIWGLWQHWLARAEYETARELAEQLLAWAQKLQDPAFLMLAHGTLANTCWLSGDFEATRTHSGQAIAIYAPQQHHSLASLYGGRDPGVAMRGSAVSLWLLGYPDQALERCREGISLARELSHATSLVHALIFNAMVHQHRRETQPTRQQAEAAIALASKQELAQYLAWATALRGWALAEQGQAEEGIAQLRQAIAGWRAVGAGALVPYVLALLADAYAKTGQTEEGLATLAEALAITEQTHEGYMEAELYRLKGELQLEPAEAEACFHQAIEIARRQKAKSFELRAVMSLCHLYRRQGKRAEARAMLAEIYRWFNEGFDTLDLKEARVLLADLNEDEGEHRFNPA